MARPELGERRPTWPVPLRLAPLADGDVDELIPEAIHGDLRARITRAAGGNPLFIGEMLAMAVDADGDVVVPPTLQALLAARLDQLEPAERNVLERGAVEGEVFHRGAVQALAPEETQVTPRLAALVRKELIRPDRPQLAGDDGFRFRHLLIRDAAYDALPKAARAELHERFAAWLEEHGTELVELDELLGYHLEQAWSYRAELGLPADDALAAAARRRLTAGGHRAARRQDYGAAARLSSVPLPSCRRTSSTSPSRPSSPTPCAGSAGPMRRSGARMRRRACRGRGRPPRRALRENPGGRSPHHLEPEGAAERLAALAEQALPVFEAAGDDLALYIAYSALGRWRTRAQADAELEARERAVVHARRAGFP